jgi:hypothetical protein
MGRPFIQHHDYVVDFVCKAEDAEVAVRRIQIRLTGRKPE